MSHSATAQYPILDVLADRWSPIAYSNEPVEEDKLLRLFEAMRWAASCNNEQPWILLVTHAGTEGFQKLSDCLVEGNAWARNAPILALSVARTVFAANGKPNRHSFYDTGMAVGNLLAQATKEGLLVHQMAGFDTEKAKQLFTMPENHDPIAIMTIGYYGDHSLLSAKHQDREEKPRQRKAAPDFVFRGEWRQV